MTHRARRVLRHAAACACLCLAAGLATGEAAAQSAQPTQSAPAAATGAVADTTPPPPPGMDAAVDSARAVRGQTLEVLLLTLGPGDAVFERFGHNALVLRDTVTGESYAYNWGMFDFDQPNFLGRFLTGDTRYWLGVFRTDHLVAAYMADNRSVRVQRLALTPTERAAMLDFVQWNSRDEHAFYRYDYYRDNCSTRVRDALDRILRGALQRDLAVTGEGRTWRSETERLLAAELPAYAGIQLALGRRAERVLSRWEEAFLPEHLADAVADLSRLDENGRRVRLVAHDSVLFTAQRRPMPSEPPLWLSMALLLGLTLAGLIAVLADSRFAAARLVLTAGVALWYFVAGVAGTALLLAATVTKHSEYMGANNTVLLANPLALIAMVLVPIALWRRRYSPWAYGVALAIAILSLAAVALQFVPSLRQHNGVVLATMVPVHVVLAFAVHRLRNGHRHEGHRPIGHRPNGSA